MMDKFMGKVKATADNGRISGFVPSALRPNSSLRVKLQIRSNR